MCTTFVINCGAFRVWTIEVDCIRGILELFCVALVPHKLPRTDLFTLGEVLYLAAVLVTSCDFTAFAV